MLRNLLSQRQFGAMKADSLAAKALPVPVLLKRSPVLPAVYRRDEGVLAFVHDYIQFPAGSEGLAFYQDEILGDFINNRRTAVRGPHGLGKTTLASLVVLWAMSVFEEVKVPTTASAWRQLTKFLWPEVHKWARRINWAKLGRAPFTTDELQTLALKLGDTREAFAVASNNPALIEGAHADHLVYIFDEAKAIPDSTWDAAEGAFSTGDCYALAISTPGLRAGKFFKIHSRGPGTEKWKTRHVKVDEAIRAGRISAEWVEDRRRDWGETSPVFQTRVLGEFPKQESNSLFSLEWIEDARQRELELVGAERAALDVARFGDDDSALCKGQGMCLFDIETWNGYDLMTTTGRVKKTGLPVRVDVVGMGGGVVDRLREQDYPVIAVNVGSRKVKDPERFLTLRDEGYFELRDRFRDGLIDLTRLPEDVYDRLTGELMAHTYKPQSDGRDKVAPKDDVKKLLGGRSPDVADSVMMFYVELPPDKEDEKAKAPAISGRSKNISRKFTT